MKITKSYLKFALPASLFISLLSMVWLGGLGMFLLSFRSDYMNQSIPPFIQNFFLFLPQYVFPFRTTWRGAINIGNIVSYITWLVVVILFSLSCYRLKIKFMVPLAVLIIVLVTILMHVFINMLGWHFELDSL